MFRIENATSDDEQGEPMAETKRCHWGYANSMPHACAYSVSDYVCWQVIFGVSRMKEEGIPDAGPVQHYP